MQETQFIQWFVLAFIQGLTEYLPISSSAHLILVSKVMGWKDQGLIMDIAAHSGSLLAVMWYFKDELVKLFQGNNWKLFNQLAIASIPLAIMGYTFSSFIENNMRSPLVIACSSIVFGMALYLSDVIGRSKKQKPKEVGMKHAMLIGLSQIFALIPGASRSGVTMSAAMAQGFSRTKAANFSFLLAIPALLMTTVYGVQKTIKQPEDYNLIGVTTVLIVSFIASFVSIKLFLKLIEKISLSVFVWYRFLLALLIIVLMK
jgi:undecaprenyl-diphosphatase